jgi:2-polyprenyl-6-methoxyphenol hydroxylase-like FAD-dependent oxidoreductase
MWTNRLLPTLGRRALVLGASMAGLLAARILCERFDEVWLLERDALPEAAAPRKGTPQALHAHGLLARGRSVLEELFPGFTAALAAQGAMVGDVQANAPFVAAGRRFAHGAVCGETGLACSRLAIEAEVRRRVLALPRVKAVTGVDVVQPTLDEAHGRVTGVRLVQRDGGAQETLAADLVVDCTGRGSRSPAWLRDWGHAAPDEERVTVALSYATAYFEREPQHAPDIAALIFAATPQLPLPGVLIAQEPGMDGVPRWVVTLGGYGADAPVPTLDGLRERARRMGDAALVRVVHEARVLGPVTRYAFPHSQRRHYERLARFPQRYLVMGDAIASFNPIYGQGMTVAACEALALRRALGTGFDGLHRRFFKAASRVVDVPWQLAVGADLAIPSVPGPRPAAVRFVNAYLARLFDVAPHDPAVAAAFMKVAHLVSPPPTIFAPGIVARVLWGGRRGRAVTGLPARSRAPG